MSTDNPYIPRPAVIEKIRRIAGREKLFRLRFADGGELAPGGEFVAVMMPGVGEAPISLCSSPSQRQSFEIAVRRIDTGIPAHKAMSSENVQHLQNVTTALFALKEGDEVGIRGPFGTDFPLHELRGKNIAFIVGGIGLFPARRPVLEIIEKRDEYGKVWLLFGTNTPEDLYFPGEFEAWKRSGVDVRVISVKGTESWRKEGRPVGYVTSLIPAIGTQGPELQETVVFIVGPPAMFKPVVSALKAVNMPDENIYLSLERLMRCSIGKCGHCRINDRLVCKDGPVFRLDDIKANLWEAL